jgi:diguanylate cyclase (GGDEF)-like protein
MATQLRCYFSTWTPSKYIIDFIGNSKKRPEGCCQIFKPLEENLRDGAHRLLPIMSNDIFGHPAGDERLKATARLLQNNIRHPDMVARYGGEEFAIILPYTTKSSALTLAERLRFASEEAYRQASSGIPSNHEMNQATINQPVPGYTMSIGVADCPEDAQTAEDLLHAADEAALIAKRQGKNRIYAAPASAPKNP